MALAELTTPISISAAILGCVGFLAHQTWLMFKKKFQRYDEHLIRCAEKSVNHAKLETRVDAIVDNQERMELKIDKLDDKLDKIFERRINPR